MYLDNFQPWRYSKYDKLPISVEKLIANRSKFKSLFVPAVRGGLYLRALLCKLLRVLARNIGNRYF